MSCLKTLVYTIKVLIIIRNYQIAFYRFVSSTEHSAWNGKELEHSLMSRITVPKRHIGVVPSH